MTRMTEITKPELLGFAGNSKEAAMSKKLRTEKNHAATSG